MTVSKPHIYPTETAGAGFVLVKKVPGTLHLLAKSPGHSFDFVAMNMSHVVHQWFFGNKPSPRRRAVRGLPAFLNPKATRLPAGNRNLIYLISPVCPHSSPPV